VAALRLVAGVIDIKDALPVAVDTRDAVQVDILCVGKGVELSVDRVDTLCDDVDDRLSEGLDEMDGVKVYSSLTVPEKV
jgi:hypothetical protein